MSELLLDRPEAGPAGTGARRLKGRGAGRRLLLLITNLALHGGAEVQAVDLGVRLKDRGWNVSVAALLPIPEPIPALVKAGIPTVSMSMRKRPGDVWSFYRLAALFHRLKPDVVHCHLTHAVIAARLTRLVAPVPVVLGTLHSLQTYSESGAPQPWLERAQRWTDSLADATSVVCREAGDYFRRVKAVSAGRLRLVPNGIDTSAFRPDAERRARLRAELGLSGGFGWLMVGRFQPVKDHCTALQAFALHRREFPPARLLLVGGGPLEPALREQCRSLGLDDSVTFLGLRRDVPALLNAADAFLLTSRMEALPMVLLEAASSGLPAVATRVGGNSDAVVEDQTGFLAPVGDAAGLASAMTRLAAAPPSEHVRMGQAARRHAVANFEFDAVMDQWEELYESLLVNKGRRA